MFSRYSFSTIFITITLFRVDKIDNFFTKFWFGWGSLIFLKNNKFNVIAKGKILSY